MKTVCINSPCGEIECNTTTRVCDLDTSVLRLFVHLVPPVVGAVTWSFLHSHCLRRKREDKRAHTELSSHPGVERVYKGQNTNGSSVSVATSSAEELRHFMPYCPGGVSGLDCSRIYRLIRGTAHHTLRSLDPSSLGGDGTAEYEEGHKTFPS